MELNASKENYSKESGLYFCNIIGKNTKIFNLSNVKFSFLKFLYAVLLAVECLMSMYDKYIQDMAAIKNLCCLIKRYKIIDI